MGWSICRLGGYGLEDMARSILCKLQIFLHHNGSCIDKKPICKPAMQHFKNLWGRTPDHRFKGVENGGVPRSAKTIGAQSLAKSWLRACQLMLMTEYL